MGYPAPFVGRVQQVEDQWTDYNGHFNMAYYNVLFDRAGDEAFAAVGLGPDYVKERNASFFTLECHNTYVRELHAGDSVRIETQFLDCDAKRVHYVQQMFHRHGAQEIRALPARCDGKGGRDARGPPEPASAAAGGPQDRHSAQGLTPEIVILAQHCGRIEPPYRANQQRRRRKS